MIINIENVEELILFNKNLRDLFPELRNIFDSWMLSYRMPGFLHLRQQAKIDMLNQLNPDKLKEFFKEEVEIIKLNNYLIKNIKIKDLYDFNENFIDFTITKSQDEVFITFWR